MKTRLWLNSIVKNEAVNLPRMLKAVEPAIQGAAITDTGSTDETIPLLEEFFRQAGKPLHLHRCEFIDFAQARNEGLRHARSLREHWDYILLCDADMELIVEQPLPPLTVGIHALMQDNKTVKYWNCRLLRHDVTIEYVGRTHECLTATEPPVALGGWWFRDHETGANRTRKYLRDIELLTLELRDDPTNPRHVFYMIQSLFGAGMLEKAREFCEFRLELGGLDEERYWTTLQMARFDELLERTPERIIREYLAAYELRPTRAEPLLHLAAFLRRNGDHQSALLFARQAATLPYPNEVLPVETDVYTWKALDEWLGCAIVCDALQEAKTAAKRLQKASLPESERERVLSNAALVLKLKGKGK